MTSSRPTLHDNSFYVLVWHPFWPTVMGGQKKLRAHKVGVGLVAIGHPDRQDVEVVAVVLRGGLGWR